MTARSRLVDILLAVSAIALGVALAYPARSGLPPPEPRPRQAAPEVPEGQSMPEAVAPRPSITEIASLFTDRRPSVPTARRQAPPSPPERVPWLRFIAFVVGSDGQTTYFFKNDQNGRVLMLTYRQPHDGWTLTGVQGNTWILENDADRYLVTGKER